MAQLVASVSGVVQGGVVIVVGSNLSSGKIFTASIGSVDSLYLSVCIYCITLVNVNAPVVATTNWWWQFSALVVA